jgi:hypothetical protein
VQNTNTKGTDSNSRIRVDLQNKVKRQIDNALAEYGNKPYSPELRDKVREAILLVDVA